MCKDGKTCILADLQHPAHLMAMQLEACDHPVFGKALHAKWTADFIEIELTIGTDQIEEPFLWRSVMTVKTLAKTITPARLWTVADAFGDGVADAVIRAQASVDTCVGHTTEEVQAALTEHQAQIKQGIGGVLAALAHLRPGRTPTPRGDA